jgi:hypothetical protein
VHGSVSLSGSKATYVPDAGYYGADSFTYTAGGPGGVSSSATVSVQVGLPAAPTIAGGSISTSYQTPGLLNLNVSGVESSITATSPAHGSVSISGTTATYTPVSGFYGSDSFQVSASGPGGTSGLALVAVSVGLPPAPAVAAGSISSSYNGSGSTALSVTGVYSRLSVSQAPAHGAVTFSGVTATYVPNGGYYGADSFAYMALGPGGVSPAATVSVQVALPPAPTAAPGSIRSAYNGSGSMALSVSGVYTGLAIAQGPAHGSVAFAGTTATYVPNTGYYGADNFTYTASGPGGVSSSAAVSVQVALPPAPTVGPGSISSSYNGSGSTTLSVSGVYSGVAVAQGPAHGSVSLSGATATYVPYAGYYGADSFTFTANGPGGVSSAATVSVQVALPPPPTTANTRLSLAYNTAGSVTLPASGVFSGAQMVNAPADGSVILSGETATYTPNAGYYGTDTFTYEIVGPGGASSTATATVTVNLPPPPTAGPASISTPYQMPGSVNLPVAGVYNQIGAVQSPSYGTVVITGATATYTPSPGFTGSDSFTYVVGGIGGVSSIATVSVSVGLPPPPVAQPLSLTTPYQTAGSVTLSATGNGTKFSLGLPPSHGSVTITGSIAVYTPSAGYFGADAFSYTVTGPGGVSPSAQVTVQVGLPAAPTANAITLITPYGAAVSTALSGAGVITGAALAAGPSHGTAIVSSSGRTATYTPTSGYVGQDQFTYTLSGPGGVSQAATITVTVVPPAPPTTAPATLTTPFQTPVSVSLGVGGIEASVALVAQPTHGTVALRGLVATYTPAAGYYGADSFSFEASGPGGTSNVSLVSITVGLPGPPTVAAATVTTPYQTPVAIALQVSGSYFSVTATSPQHGALSLSGTTAVYTPSSGFMGVDTFTFTAVGVGGSAAPAQVRVTVGRPGVPAAVPEQLTAPYQTPASVGLAAVGVATGFAIAVQPSHGVAVVSNGSALYTPASGYSGPDSFTYVAIGPGGTSGPATVSVTVLPTSSAAPLVQPLTASTPYQTPVVMALQVAGAYANLGIVAQPAHGSVVLVGASATYTPAQGFSGPDTYTVQAAAPGGALSNVQTMTVFVGYPATANVAPIYITTPYQTPVTAVLGAVGLGIYAATTRPSHGSVGIAGNLATYTPAAAFIGTDSFAFNLTLSDGSVASAKFTVVVAPPAPPAAQPQTIYTAYQSPTTVPLTISGVYSTVSVVAQPSSGNLAINNGQVTYTPVSGFSGTVTFTYTASGAGGTSSVTTVTIVVAPPPPPMGAPASTTTPYGAPVSIALTASGVYATITVATPPAHGMVTLSGTTASYTPAPGFVGTDSFTYVVAGPGGTSQAQTVTITVSPPPPPMGAPASTTTPYGASVSIPLSVSGIYTTISVAMPPAHGTVAISGTTATYTPTSGFFGTDTFTYVVVGPGGTSQAVTVTVTVLPPPPPSGSPVSTTTPYGATVGIPLTVSGIYTAINVVAAPGHGSVTISGTTATYTPAPGFFGTDTFTYVVVGPGGTSQVVTVTVIVLPPPPPVGAPASATTPNGAPVTITLSVSGIYTSILVATPPAHGTVAISGSTATYTPAPGFAGVDSFTFVVVGPGGKSQVVTVTITVLPGPVPIAPNLTEVVKSGASLSLPVAQGIAGAPVTQATVATQPTEGRAAVDGLLIVYSAPTEYDGVTRFTYTLTNEWGVSAPGTITVQIEPVPIPAVKQASVLTGKTVTVDLTAGAAGGPFTSAAVLSISPGSAGSAVIKPDGAGGFELVFSPTGALQNKLVVQYTLANLYASAIGVVDIQVNPRPDPALDPEVTGVVNAFAQAADRFIDGQLGNIEARLDSLHNGPRRSHLGLSLLPMATVEAMGQAGTEQMQRDMDYYLKAGMVEPGPADDRTRSGKPPPGEAADPGWSAWLGGAISLGYQYGQGETLGGFSFSTTGLSGGVDANLAKHWIGGVGLGYAQDESHIGRHTSKVLSSSIDAFLYETWQPTEKTFLDAVIGAGGLAFGERRYLTTDGGTVTGRTSGADAFGSIKAGYDHRGRRWHVSPYLAFRVSYVAISRFAEPEDPTDTWSLIY